MRRVLLAIVFVCIFVRPVTSFAWGKVGHTIVAEIAFSMIDEPTKENIRKYLGKMTLEEASNWMDAIKSDRRNDYMSPWHYVNVEKGNTYDPATKDANVINQLERIIAELEHKEKMDDEEVKKNLLMLFHLVGDMHQPLHVGYGVDRGGNDVHVKYKGQQTKLHKVWDSEIIENENITFAACIQQKRAFDRDELAMLGTINVENWMRQPRSYLNSAYDFKDGTIDDAYVQRNRKIIEQELFIGGVRLAAVLKKTFGSN